MPFRRVTRRARALACLCVAAYTGLGFWFAHNAAVETWLYRLGLTAASFVPLFFVGIYTAFGLKDSIPAAKWWYSKLGSAIVIAALSLVPLAAPLAWVFWFDGGMLTSTWLAWLEVSGPAVSALAWLRVSWIWLAVHALEEASGLPEEAAD